MSEQPDRLAINGETGIGLVYCLRRKDTTAQWFGSYNFGPIRGRGGEIVGAVVTAQDVTAEKRAEEARRKADRRKDEFLAVLAHELRNPLAPIHNAVQALRKAQDAPAPPGGAIDIAAERQGDMVRVAVRDNGIGIPPESLPHVFELFIQGGSGRRAGGLGVGLALTCKLVQLHGGTIEGPISASGRQKSTWAFSRALNGMPGATASFGSCTIAAPPQSLTACNPAVPSSR